MPEQNIHQQEQDLHLLQTLISRGCSSKNADAKLLADLCFHYPYYAIKYFAELDNNDTPEIIGYHRKCRQAANLIMIGTSTKLKWVLALPPTTKQEEERRERVLRILAPLLTEQAKWN